MISSLQYMSDAASWAEVLGFSIMMQEQPFALFLEVDWGGV